MIPAQLPKALFVPQTAVSSTLTFRPMTKQDKTAVYAACYPERPFLAFNDHCRRMLQWQQKGRCCWLLACADPQTIVGSGQLICYPNSGELANLAVTPSYQGQKIGTVLIELLTAVAAHANLSYLEISVHQTNSRAKKLYEQLGFVVDRQLKHPPAFVLRRLLRSDSVRGS